MKRIGIIGAGQAGQRIAVALSAFDDVEVTGIVDPVNGRELLSSPDSEWRIPGVTFYSEDPAMLNNEYDGIIVAADPINVAGHKPDVLRESGVSIPLLWERPFGHKSTHPATILDTVPSQDNSVMSFARFGLPSKILADCINTEALGDIVDFEIFITLNCGLRQKTWRQDGKVTQPIHLLDTAYELIESVGLGKIDSVSSTRQDATRDNVSFDEKWVVSLGLDTGITGRVVGIQYLGDAEFLYSLRQIRIVGTKGAFVSSMGNTYLIDEDGSITKKSIGDYPSDNRISAAVEKLEAFFKSVDGYHPSTGCKGEAVSLAECLRAWVDHLGNQGSISGCSVTSPTDSTSYLAVGEAAEKSASTGNSQTVG